MTTQTAINSTIFNLDDELNAIRNRLNESLGSDEAVLGWLNSDIEAMRQMGVERGFGSAQSLISEAKRHANKRHPFVGHQPECLAAPIVRALRLWSGMSAAIGEHESGDQRLGE